MPILLYGSEAGLIHKLVKSIYSAVNYKSEFFEISYLDYSSSTTDDLKNISKSSSLFAKNNFIVVKNPKEKILEELEALNTENNFLIIIGNNITSKSKLKSFFDFHKKYFSVACYPLNKNEIKIIVDNFIKKNSIKLEDRAYWYILENISEDFLSLENELDKLNSLKNLQPSLEDIRKLIFLKNGPTNDTYFTNCVTGQSESILKDIHTLNPSNGETYEILISMKNFLNILFTAFLKKNHYSLDDLVKQYWPRYLFLKKEIFKIAIKKINLKKIIKINMLIQKTEIALRKNSGLHKEILERFLLNLTRIIK